MLMLNMLTLSLLTLSQLKVKSWTYVITVLMMMVATSMWTIQYSSMTPISPLSMLDSMSSTLILLSIWVNSHVYSQV